MQTDPPVAMSVSMMLDKKMAAAYSDPRSAIAAAMLIHVHPAAARSKPGLNIDYDSLLSIGLKSTDPEILTSTGELLMEGKCLARNVRLGMRYFAKANKTSAFMGAFMIARIDVLQSRPIAIRMLKQARSAGHIPSSILLERLHLKRLRKMGLPMFPLKIIHGLTCGRKISNGLKDTGGLYERFWRYKDIIPASYERLANALPVDRASPFQDVRDLNATSDPAA